MKSVREINIKPSCMREIHGYPQADSANLWEKINYLVDDPIPDGKLKKKLKVYDKVYRIRVGDYRLFYTFGDSWVSLLGLRRREEKSYKEHLKGAQDPIPQKDPDADDTLDEILAEEGQKKTFKFDSSPEQTELPHKITPEWLEALKIPAIYIPTFVSCTTEESLLGLKVPGEYLEIVIDNIFPKPMEDVVSQPDLLVQDTDQLIRYKESGLLAFLLKLDEDQKKLAKWALKGPTMVKGGAGTGKSTVALYRVKSLLEQPGASDPPKLLFTTYTRALIAASQQLLNQLLTPEQFKRVRVATCDQIAREIVAEQRAVGNLEQGAKAHQILTTLRPGFKPTGPTDFDRRLRAKALEQFSNRYLKEEFDWIIAGRGLKTLDEYLGAPRPGRGYAFREGMRRAVWELYTAYQKEIEDNGIEQFSSIRAEALEIVRRGGWKRHFDYVVVDEAQDLTPNALCLMAEIAKSAEGLFLASDTKQSLYSRNYTWSIAHPRLRFKGRTALLKRNYRSTREIDKAAYDILEPEEGEELDTSISIHEGPMPVLLDRVEAENQGEWAAKFIAQMSQHLRMKRNTAAVLVPNQKIGKQTAKDISQAGIPARFFQGRELDLEEDIVKVITLHSAKGLEFPIVVVCGLELGTYPERNAFSEASVYDERMRQHRRLLYVGMTRAMRGLMVVRTKDCENEALLNLDEQNWHVENAA